MAPNAWNGMLVAALIFQIQNIASYPILFKVPFKFITSSNSCVFKASSSVIGDHEYGIVIHYCPSNRDLYFRDDTRAWYCSAPCRTLSSGMWMGLMI